jgi:hypothetical protein
MDFGHGEQIPVDLAAARARQRGSHEIQSGAVLGSLSTTRHARDFGFLCNLQRVAIARRIVCNVLIRSYANCLRKVASTGCYSEAPTLRTDSAKGAYTPGLPS